MAPKGRCRPGARSPTAWLPTGSASSSPQDKWAVAPLLRGLEPDVVLCCGFGWKLPQEALDVARLGSVNQHPGKLPRHRGPIPMAWALREGDGEFGVTWHRMDAELDTGPILAQATVPIEDDDCTIEEIGPKLTQASFGLLPQVFERLAAGDPGDPQAEEGATWAGHFGEDYATVDWAQPARKIHDQVRAWWLTFGMSEAKGPIAELTASESSSCARASPTREAAREPSSPATGPSGSSSPSPSIRIGLH